MTEQEPTFRRSLIGKWFPTRYLYLRDGESVRAWALTPGKQAAGAIAALALAACGPETPPAPPPAPAELPAASPDAICRQPKR